MTTTTAALTWTRRYGHYLTVGLSGQHEFQADAYRQADGQWALHTYTWGRPQDRQTFRTLAEAKAWAQTVADILA